MSESKLVKDLVADTSLSVLSVRFSPRRLDVMIYSDMEANSLISHTSRLNPTPSSWLPTVEDTVYENPLLLSDFRSVFLTIEPEASMLLPDAVDSDTDAAAIAAATIGGDNREWLVDRQLGRNAALAFAVPQGLTGFVRRTWGADASLRSNLGVLARYFILSGRHGKPSRILLNLRDDEVDLIAVDRGAVRLSNTFTIRGADDAVYYTLAARTRSAMPDDAEILVSGNQQLREQVIPSLRRFAPAVMPVIFPPRMFRAGREAVNLPFDLTVTPICE